MDDNRNRNNNNELSPDGIKILSVLENKSELPPFINGIINEELNNIATAFLSKIRLSIQDLIFEENVDEEEEAIRDTSLAKTIVDNDWNMVEKQYENIIRFFPDLLSEKRYGAYPIQWMASYEEDKIYNLRNVSIIPLVTKLGIELQQFDEELRGGFLSTGDNVRNVLQYIMCYYRMEKENSVGILSIWIR